MNIPYDAISPSALRGLIEELITREGTEHGDRDVPLETKVLQVMSQLKLGTAVILYDPETEGCGILPARV